MMTLASAIAAANATQSDYDSVECVSQTSTSPSTYDSSVRTASLFVLRSSLFALRSSLFALRSSLFALLTLLLLLLLLFFDCRMRC
jgi:hypothetical protein